MNFTRMNVICTSNDFAHETWNHNKGIELHLADRQPSDLANHFLLGSMDDNTDPSLGKYHKTDNNLHYVINITQTFTW